MSQIVTCKGQGCDAHQYHSGHHDGDLICYICMVGLLVLTQGDKFLLSCVALHALVITAHYSVQNVTKKT